MLNALTIDLEDYYQVSAFESVVKRENWDKYESRIERNTHRLLDILNGSLRTAVRATFFCLGWNAERYPGLIKRIKEEGHEIACHGYDHQLVYSLNPKQFREDVRKSKKLLEDIVGEEVVGYRAPSYSINRKSLWAFEILVEEGYRYDSSIFPIYHDRYGMPNAPRFPFVIPLNGNSNVESGITPSSEFRTPNLEMNGLLEFPLSTVRICGRNLPISGGGYFRLFPYPVTKRALERINGKERRPFIFYLHPWEIDPEQPKIQGTSVRSQFRHYLNLLKTEAKLKRLLEDFSFSSIKDTLGATYPA